MSEKLEDNDIVKSLKKDLEKSELESIKSKLKEILKKRMEAEKTIRSFDLEIEKIIKDYNNGIS